MTGGSWSLCGSAAVDLPVPTLWILDGTALKRSGATSGPPQISKAASWEPRFVARLSCGVLLGWLWLPGPRSETVCCDWFPLERGFKLAGDDRGSSAPNRCARTIRRLRLLDLLRRDAIAPASGITNAAIFAGSSARWRKASSNRRACSAAGWVG